MKTFTFIYDPTVSMNQMFDDLKRALKTKKPHVEESVVKAQSIDAILSTMTGARLDLFYCVAREKPESMYQLAKFLGRDQSNVLRDAKALEQIGILKLKSNTTGGREKIKPITSYDRIVFDFGAASKLAEVPQKKVI